MTTASLKKAQVVIGANFGDEGKGLATDYLCSKTGPETLVVRFNGGAHSTHTVTAPDGTRHVFGHTGSGVLVGCPTFLSRFFVCNPSIFLKEWARLETAGIRPVVYIDPRAPVTTPYDIIANQCIETFRGRQKHGSCGIGFGETVERNLNPDTTLVFAELDNETLLRAKLERIRDTWIPGRLRALGLWEIPEPWNHLIAAPKTLDEFLDDVKSFLAKTETAPPDLLQRNPHIVFEGAQGLLLDQDHGFFPHVTRSSTGLKNVVELAKEAGITEIETWYMTRSYITRHGAGPMPNESPKPVYTKIHDPTNVANRYQGAVRFGLLDADLLRETIWRDIRHVPASMKFTYGLAVSCMDQIDDLAHYMARGHVHSSPPDTFLRFLQRETETTKLIASYGPSRQDVRDIPVNYYVLASSTG